MSGMLKEGLIVAGLLGLAAAPQSASEPYTLAACTFFGGSGYERAQGCAVDGQGFIYIVGNTSSPDLPTTPNAFQRTMNGPADGYVAKLSPDGRSLVWCTYLGGPGSERCYGVVVDAAGFVYVTTWVTGGPSFPTTPGAYDRTFHGVNDVAITKLTPDGSTLVLSTIIGGSGNEQSRGAIFVDSSGNVYGSGTTNSPDFPTTPGAFQRSIRGAGDAFVFKLSSDGSQLLFSTLFGGSHPTFEDTAVTGVKVHTDGTIYIAGTTRSTDLPVTPNAYQRTYGGDTGALSWHGDAFVARFTPDLSSLIYCTYLGGSSGEESSVNNGLTVDSQGRAILIGNTTSTDFPTTPGAFQTTYRGGAIGDGFVAILSADGSQLLASTYIGGTGSEETSGIAVDAAGNVYFSGNTGSPDYPVTSNAVQPTYRGGAGFTDAWFTKLSPNLSTLLYSTYLGSSSTTGDDRGRCLDLGPGGIVVVTGDALGSDFPVTAGAYDTTYNGGGDAFVAKFNLSASSPTITMTPPPSSTSTSPLVVTGSASGGTVTSVTWANAATGQSGTATGTANWTATIPLAPGANTITITAFNSSGGSSSQTFTVTYSPSGTGGGGGGHHACGATGMEIVLLWIMVCRVRHRGLRTSFRPREGKVR